VPPSSQDQKGIIQKAKQGNRSAISMLYEMYADLIYRYISSRVPLDEVEDLTSEVFLNMVESLPAYEITGAPFEAWLYRIAAARVADYYRSRSRNPQTELLETMSDDTIPKPEEVLLEQQETLELKTALNELSQEEQTILLLRFVERKSHREVAKIVNKSEMAVRSIQHRALVRLTRLLGTNDKARHYLRGRHG